MRDRDRTKWLHGLLTAAVLATSVLAGGCYVYGTTAVVVDTPPPPPRHVVVRTRPGYVYVNGYWQMRGSSWVWVDGYWQPQRVGHVYVPGRWIHRGGRYHWVDPHWQARGSVTVRGDRRVRTAPRVRVRDHRERDDRVHIRRR